MDIEKRLQLVQRNTEEVITHGEMRSLLETKAKPRAYWGFETSGLMHIGMGLVCGRKIIDMIEAGFDFIVFLADWHSWINNKLGGNMENIRICGEYLRQCFTALGVPTEARYLWASELASRSDYWEKVIRVGKSVNVSRVWRALPIMGRGMDQSDLEAASTFYPCMQVADIFQMELDVACAGMDQRKAHALARDVADKLGWHKPTSLHTHLLPGLTSLRKMDTKYDENQELSSQITGKMSKSVADSGIIVHDEPESIRKKVRSAYCPAKEIEDNPVIAVARYAVFPWLNKIEVERPQRFGGPVTFTAASELEEDYRKGKVHPLDLKNSVAESLIRILSPAREATQREPELFHKMQSIGITR